MKVTGWKQVATQTVSGITYTCEYNGEGLCKVKANGTDVSLASGHSHETTNWISTPYKPSTTQIRLSERSVSNNILFYMWTGGNCGITNTYSSTKTANIQFEVVYGV